jgi:hypothetical protein
LVVVKVGREVYRVSLLIGYDELSSEDGVQSKVDCG